MSAYTDFDIAVGERSGDRYPLELLDSPYGQRQTATSLTVVASELATIREIVANPAYAVGDAQVEAAARARDFGVALFDSLLGGDLNRAYGESRSRATDNNQLLRIKLRIRAPELRVLPWELMYDSDLEQHILLHDQLSLVRLPESAGGVRQLRVEGPLRILGIVVDLKFAPSIGAQVERENLTSALATLEKNKVVDVEWVDNPSWRELEDALNRGPWHVVHFIGHAGFDERTSTGYVVLASDEVGGVEPVPADQPADKFAAAITADEHVRLAVINACESGGGRQADATGGLASLLVRSGLSAAIGMQNVISDGAAIEFSRQLYEQIAQMRPLDQAVAAARAAMNQAVPHTLEWAIPTLHMQSLDGMIFERPVAGIPVPDLVTEGITSFQTGNWTRAAEVFDEAIAAEPGQTEIRVWRALVDVSRDSMIDGATRVIDQLIPELEALLAAHPDDANLIALRGLGLAAIGRHADAIIDLDKSIDIAPDSAGTRVARARCHLALADPQQALADLDVAVRLLPNSARAYALRADAFAATGEHRKAITDLTKALELHPGGPYRSARSQQYAAIDEYGNAARDLDFDIERQPSVALYVQRAQLNYKRAYHAAGERNFEPAISDYTSALALEPDNANLFAARAAAHYESAVANHDGRSASLAADDYRQATELQRDDGRLHYRLALALQQSGDGKAARAAFRTAAQLGDRDAREALPFWRRWFS